MPNRLEMKRKETEQMINNIQTENSLDNRRTRKRIIETSHSYITELLSFVTLFFYFLLFFAVICLYLSREIFPITYLLSSFTVVISSSREFVVMSIYKAYSKNKNSLLIFKSWRIYSCKTIW